MLRQEKRMQEAHRRVEVWTTSDIARADWKYSVSVDRLRRVRR
jgi:hypothetical protein